MKKLKCILPTFIITCSLFLFACGGTGDDGVDPIDTANTITAQVDGQQFTAESVVASRLPDLDDNSTLGYTVSGVNETSGQLLQLNLVNVTATGQYDIGENDLSSSYKPSAQITNDIFFAFGLGVVTTSELSETKITGTFSFEAQNNMEETVSAADGAFSATISN